MTTNYPHQTAKIYQFPIGGRATPGGLRHDTRPVRSQVTPGISQTPCGESWYHEASIEDAKRTYEH